MKLQRIGSGHIDIRPNSECIHCINEEGSGESQGTVLDYLFELDDGDYGITYRFQRSMVDSLTRELDTMMDGVSQLPKQYRYGEKIY